MRFAAPVAGVTGVVLAVAAMTISDVPRIQADQGPSILIYREPDDPIERVLVEANARIYSDFAKDYAAEASARGLRALDEAIATRPDDPRLHWLRNLTLDRMERTAEARAARKEAIRLARIRPGGGDLLGDYYREHAETCAKEGDPAAAAAVFLARLDMDPEGPSLPYQLIAISLHGSSRKNAAAPGPGPLFPGRERLEALWGPLDRFFESHAGPADAAALERVADRVRVGMDYREVARAAGFPGYDSGLCHWDHGIPVMDSCWHYTVEEPTIVHQGNFIGAIPPADPVIVHVVIVDKLVKKVERTRGRPPQDKTHRHGERASFLQERDFVTGVAFSPDGTLVAAGGFRGAVHLREVRGGRERAVLRVPEVKENDYYSGSLRPVAFAPDGKTLAAGGLRDGTVRLWDVATSRLRATLEVIPPAKNGGMGHVESLAFAPDGKTLATVGNDRDLRLWDVATGRLRASLRGHADSVAAVAYSPDGRTLATGDHRGTVRLWDVAAGRPRALWPGYAQAVVALAFAPDGKTLAVARDQTVVRLRDLTTDRWRVEIPHSRPYGSQSLAFSPDGKTLAVAGACEVATLWDASTGRMIGILEGHARFPEAVAFSPDGKTLATGSVDGALKLWDAPGPIAPVRPGKP